MKMKKMMLLMLTLLIWSTASVNAQVTIGSDKAPHSGAILDLQSDNLGLKLPNVALDDDLTVFKLPVTDTSTAADAKGMYVYNTNPTIGEGVYVWDGYQWILVKESPGANPVKSISIISESGAFSALPKESINLTAIVSPLDADNSEIAWSIQYATGFGSFRDGTFVGSIPGIVFVTASAKNGITKTIRLDVITAKYNSYTVHMGSHDYEAVDIAGKSWLTSGSLEGAYSHPPLEDGKHEIGAYYSYDQANTDVADDKPCKNGYRIPQGADIYDLLSFLDSPEYADAIKFFKPHGNIYTARYNMAGSLNNVNSNWFWTHGKTDGTLRESVWFPSTATDSPVSFMLEKRYRLQVRCVKTL